jgi:hypothetical protein
MITACRIESRGLYRVIGRRHPVVPEIMITPWCGKNQTQLGGMVELEFVRGRRDGLDDAVRLSAT